MNHLISKLVFQSRYWILFIFLNSSFSSNAQTFVNLESGALFTNINDIRKGNNGTLTSNCKSFIHYSHEVQNEEYHSSCNDVYHSVNLFRLWLSSLPFHSKRKIAMVCVK